MRQQRGIESRILETNEKLGHLSHEINFHGKLNEVLPTKQNNFGAARTKMMDLSIIPVQVTGLSG